MKNDSAKTRTPIAWYGSRNRHVLPNPTARCFAVRTRNLFLALLAIVPFLIASFGCKAKETPRPSPSSNPAVHPKQVEFHADDGTRVYADLYETEAKKDAPIILLFHQARSNAAEYATIAPRLVAEGFNCLAVDLRSGGTAWQRNNRTAEQFQNDPGYESAYRDMTAAVEWAKTQGYSKIIAWGSSYSASLVLRLAAENSDVKEAIAFSPGEYFDDKGVVARWASKLNIPVFISCAPNEVKDVEPIFEAIPTEDKAFNTPKESVHGSSALREDKNAEGAESVWAAVLDFLRGVEESGGDESVDEPEAQG